MLQLAWDVRPEYFVREPADAIRASVDRLVACDRGSNGVLLEQLHDYPALQPKREHTSASGFQEGIRLPGSSGRSAVAVVQPAEVRNGEDSVDLD
jgi:hypothetical protein